MNFIKVDVKTLEALEILITGNSINSGAAIAPYRKGTDLVTFFNQLGFEDEYDRDFPSRSYFAASKISSLNGTSLFKQLIEMTVDPRHYIGSDFCVDNAVDYLNRFLEFDGLKLIKQGHQYRLSALGKELVFFDHAIFSDNTPNIEFIKEQVRKCTDKINLGDYDGAITNARSLLESVLVEIEAKTNEEKPEYKGDLVRLYRRVQKILNLEPSRKDISDSLKQVLTGMISIVNGIAPMRNKMSDSHVREYKPAERHAQLAVNSVNTICIFLLDSFEYQVRSGYVKIKNNSR